MQVHHRVGNSSGEIRRETTLQGTISSMLLQVAKGMIMRMSASVSVRHYY